MGSAFLGPLKGNKPGEDEAADGVQNGEDRVFHSSRIGVLGLEADFFHSGIAHGIEHGEDLFVA